MKFAAPTPARGLDVQYAVVALMFLPDPVSGLVSAILIQEKLTLPEPAFGTFLPYRAMFHVDGDGDYEVRCTWVGAGGEAPAGDGKAEALSLKGRQKFVAPALRMPPSAGGYRLVLEWRRPGQKLWDHGASSFPIDVEVIRSTGAAVASKALVEGQSRLVVLSPSPTVTADGAASALVTNSAPAAAVGSSNAIRDDRTCPPPRPEMVPPQ